MMFSLHFDNTYKKPPFDKSSLYKFLLKKAGKLLHHPKDNIVLSIKDQYRKDVLDICLRITNQFDLLSLSKKLLREKKSRWGSKSNNIKNGEFIRYHLEAYLFRITTIRDLILKLLNRVNKLGLKENSYLEFSIKKKSDQTNNIKLSEHIEIVHSVFQEIKPIRNKIAHGAYYENVELILIEGSDLLSIKDKKLSLNSKDYKELLDNLLMYHYVQMYLNEEKMNNFLYIIMNELNKIRIKIERESLTKN